jgi:hypothetical protein
LRIANVGTKKNRPAGRFFYLELITLLEQQQRQPKQQRQQPKQPTKQQQQRPKQPKQRRQQPKRQLQQLRLELEQQQELQRLELQLELLLFCCKQPKQQPTGRRSAGIFSWGFP